jgi:hypothetical protein
MCPLRRVAFPDEIVRMQLVPKWLRTLFTLDTRTTNGEEGQEEARDH